MRISRGLAAAAALAVTATAVACNGEDDDAPDNGADGNAEASEEKVIEMPDQPGSVEDYAGALDDAEVETCESQDGALQVSGTVTNPESEDQDYRIYVSAMDSGDTMGIIQVDVTGVAGGDSAEWNTEFPLSGQGLDCVLRVERFAAQ